MSGGVNDFDLSDVPDGTIVKAESFATGALKFFGKKVAVNVLTKVLLAIPEMEIKRIIAENDLRRAYEKFIHIMDAIAKERRGACKADELTESCPISATFSQFYQSGRTTDGTAAMRLYTMIGDDGEVIQIQGYDLMPRLNITVVHKNGRVINEDVSPRDALMLLRWLAGVKG
jgi:hypothetical protein